MTQTILQNSMKTMGLIIKIKHIFFKYLNLFLKITLTSRFLSTPQIINQNNKNSRIHYKVHEL